MSTVTTHVLDTSLGRPAAGGHHHVLLVLSPFAYSTCRGS
jgi:5-hydroxyisourate hydrolase-like protein (transthyretin family)